MWYFFFGATVFGARTYGLVPPMAYSPCCGNITDEEMLRHTILIGLMISSFSGAFEYPVLPLSDLKKEVQRSCVLVHIWAAWCAPCIEEMPKFLRFFEKEKNVYPLIIDTSAKFAQDSFSKPWMKNLAPQFKVYRKPASSDQALIQAIGISWPKALPFSALYSFGKKKKEWVGQTSLEELHKVFQELCPAR